MKNVIVEFVNRWYELVVNSWYQLVSYNYVPPTLKADYDFISSDLICDQNIFCWLPLHGPHSAFLFPGLENVSVFQLSEWDFTV